MGENQRHDHGQTGDAAQAHNERGCESEAVCDGKGTVEESKSRWQARALRLVLRLCFGPGFKVT